METIDLQVALRPPRVVFIYSSQSHVNKIIEINTKLWGGLFNPILTKREFKKLHDRIVFDFLVPLVKLEKNIEKIYEHKIIKEADFFANSPAFLNSLDLLPTITQITEPVREVKSSARKKDKRRASFYFGNLPHNTVSLDPYNKLKDFGFVDRNWINDAFIRSWFTPLSLMALQLRFTFRGRPMNQNGLMVVSRPLSLKDFVYAWNLRSSGYKLTVIYEDEIPSLSTQIKEFGESKINKVGANRHITIYPNIFAHHSQIQKIAQLIQTNVPQVPFIFCDLEGGFSEGIQKALFATTDWVNKSTTLEQSFIKVDVPEIPLISQVESDAKVGCMFQIPFGAKKGGVLFPPPNIKQKELAYVGLSSPSDGIRIHEDLITKFDYNFGKVFLSFNSFFDFWGRFFKLEHNLSLHLSKPGINMVKIISALGGLQGGCRILKLPATREILHSLQNDKHLTISDTKQIIGKAWGNAKVEHGLHFFNKNNLIDQLCIRGITKQGYILKCKECENTKWYPLGSVSQNWICDFCDFKQRTSLLRDNHIGIKANGLFQIRGGAQGALTSILTLWRFNAHENNPIFLPSFVLKNEKGVDVLECDFLALQSGRGGRPELILGESKSKGELKAKDFSQIIKLRKLIGLDDVYFCFSFLHDDIQGKLKTNLARSQKKNNKTIILAAGELNPYETWNCFPKYHQKHFVSIDDLSQATVQKYL